MPWLPQITPSYYYHYHTHSIYTSVLELSYWVMRWTVSKYPFHIMCAIGRFQVGLHASCTFKIQNYHQQNEDDKTKPTSPPIPHHFSTFSERGVRPPVDISNKARVLPQMGRRGLQMTWTAPNEKCLSREGYGNMVPQKSMESCPFSNWNFSGGWF